MQALHAATRGDHVGLERRPNPARAPMTEAELFALFLEERTRFARRYPGVAEASLEISELPCNRDRRRCAPRDVAECYWSSAPGEGRKHHQRVVIVRRALALPRDNVVAVIRHELGHLADARIDEPGAEKRADAIAVRVGGQPIRYDANDLQTVGPGRPDRPSHLHQ